MNPAEAKIGSKYNVTYKQGKALLFFFIVWKCILFAVAALAPGPGYDTSALILSNPDLSRHEMFKEQSFVESLALKLFRWDTFYFVKAAQRDKVHEQEWAFSWAYSRMIRVMTEFFPKNEGHSLSNYLWTSIATSNLMHGAAVVSLFSLLNRVVCTPNSNRVSFVACALHIVSPAGIFLVAPYTESMFAMLNFCGMLCYVQSRNSPISNQTRTVKQDAMLSASGLIFSCATMIRSNGLLSGLLFVSDVVSCVPGILNGRTNRHELRFVVVTCFAGALLALGYVLPQYMAFREYCTPVVGVTTPPWCHKMIPSVYSWVQSKYWNVGLFRYWTLSNLPLFLLAAPMLWLLLQSSAMYLRDFENELPEYLRLSHGIASTEKTGPGHVSNGFPQLVLPQIALTLAATMSFHVQIINRLSSGYPMWYLSVAKSATTPSKLDGRGKLGLSFQVILRGMIMYAIIQGALFANFLPPA